VIVNVTKYTLVSFHSERVCTVRHGSDLKEDGYGSFNYNPTYMLFPAAADLVLAPLNRPTTLAAVVFLVAGVELHSLGWGCSTSGALIDVK
jgi:hypothetical protein